MKTDALKQLCPATVFRALQRFANREARSYYARFSAKGIIENKIVFLAPTRDALSGNLLFIWRALEGAPFEKVALFEKDCDNLEQVMQHVATAHYVIADDFVRFMYALSLHPKQKFIQVWHSAGAFKRMGFARMGREGSTQRGSLTHRNYTDVVVSSEGVVGDFAQAFGVDRAKVHPFGVARSDIFFDETYCRNTREELRAHYGISPSQKVVLFAPTYRGNDAHSAYYPASYMNLDAFANGLGEEVVLVVKYHPFIKERPIFTEDEGHRIIDLSRHREINDVLLMSDVLITDYSSVIFEYALLNKPLVFYTPDSAEYVKKRDFFYDFSTYCYGPVEQTQDELTQRITEVLAHGEEVSVFQRDVFIKKFMGACDGHATKRFIEKILNYEEQGKQ